jgi:hypothetical protein
MTQLQTTALVWAFAIAIIFLLFVLAWFEIHRPVKLTPEEVADAIAALLNEHQVFLVSDAVQDCVTVQRFPEYLDADNIASGNRIISVGSAS